MTLSAASPTSAASGPDHIANPLAAETVPRIKRVLVGEILDGYYELTIVETIVDAYRLEKLKIHLRKPFLTKKPSRGSAGQKYHLIFVDDQDQIVAAYAYYFVSHLSYILQPTQYAYKKDGRYCVGVGSDYSFGVRHYLLPGNWDPAVPYVEYVLPLEDWAECVGYTPPR